MEKTPSFTFFKVFKILIITFIYDFFFFSIVTSFLLSVTLILRVSVSTLIRTLEFLVTETYEK